MSQVKFEQNVKETIRTTAGAPPTAAPGGQFGARDLPRDASRGKEDLAHEVGNALTQGSGPNGYLAVRTPVSMCLRRE
jgi:hypothetical protein